MKIQNMFILILATLGTAHAASLRGIHATAGDCQMKCDEVHNACYAPAGQPSAFFYPVGKCSVANCCKLPASRRALLSSRHTTPGAAGSARKLLGGLFKKKTWDSIGKGVEKLPGALEKPGQAIEKGLELGGKGALGLGIGLIHESCLGAGGIANILGNKDVSRSCNLVSGKACSSVNNCSTMIGCMMHKLDTQNACATGILNGILLAKDILTTEVEGVADLWDMSNLSEAATCVAANAAKCGSG